jgi:hypothetical protein
VLEFDHLDVEAGGAFVGREGGGEVVDAVLDGVAAEAKVHAAVFSDGMEEPGRLGAGDSAVAEDELVKSQGLALVEPPGAILEKSFQVVECCLVELKRVSEILHNCGQNTDFVVRDVQLLELVHALESGKGEEGALDVALGLDAAAEVQLTDIGEIPKQPRENVRRKTSRVPGHRQRLQQSWVVGERLHDHVSQA